MAYNNILKDINNEFSRIKTLYKNKNEYDLHLIQFFSSVYISIESKENKQDIIDECLKIYLNSYIFDFDEEIYKVIKYLLNQNIFFNNFKFIVSSWVFVNELVKRKDFLLINDNNKYRVELVKEYEGIYYKDIYKI